MFRTYTTFHANMYWSFGIVAYFFSIICLVNAGYVWQKEVQINNKRLNIPSTFDRLEACLNESDLLFSNINEHRDIFRMRHNHISRLINSKNRSQVKKLKISGCELLTAGRGTCHCFDIKLLVMEQIMK